jgi:hypothetical protein
MSQWADIPFGGAGQETILALRDGENAPDQIRTGDLRLERTKGLGLRSEIATTMRPK